MPVNKVLVEQPTSEPKVKAYVVIYEPLQVVKCKGYGRVKAETNKSGVRLNSACTPSKLKELRGAMSIIPLKRGPLEF